MSLTTSGFVNPLKQAQSAVNGAVSGMRSSLSGMHSSLSMLTAAAGAIGISFAGFKSAEGFLGAIKEVAETGKTLKMLSGTTGQSIRDLVILRKTFDEVGIGAESVPQALTMMQKALGGVNEQGEPTKKVFEQLGLSIDKLKGQSAIDALSEIGESIASLADESSKAAATAAVFGRSGQDLRALFADPAVMKDAARDYAELGNVMQQNAVQFAHFAVTMEKLKGKMTGIFAGLTKNIAPQIDFLLTKLKDSFDSIKLGEKIGDLLTAGVEAAKADKLGEIIGLGIAAGLEKIGPRIKEVLSGPLNEWSAGVQARLEVLGITGNNTTFLASAAYRGLTEGKSIDVQADERKKQILLERSSMPKEIPAHSAGDAFQRAMAPLRKSAEEIRKSAETSLGTKAADGDKAPGWRTFASAGAAGGGAKIPEGDRFAKIGLFVGQGGPINDYLRRSATGIEKLVALLGTTNPSRRLIKAPLTWGGV